MSNPWVTSPSEAQPGMRTDATAERPQVRGPHARGSARPQNAIPAVDTVDRLPRRDVDDGAAWVLGVHGGAGETTLAAWLDASPAGHAWPIAPSSAPVLLVARTHAAGLAAAARAATEWASGAVPVQLLGLVVIADMPGRLPAPLRAAVRRLKGTVPATWALRYVPDLRLDAEPPSTAPDAVIGTVRSIAAAIPTSKGNQP